MMGTKSKPGEFDCYEAAAPDEPMFVLLARDDSAPERVEEWARKRFERAAERLGRESLARTGGQCINDNRADTTWMNRELHKIAEALTCATAMRDWKRKTTMPFLIVPETGPIHMFPVDRGEDLCTYPGCSCGGTQPAIDFGHDEFKLLKDFATERSQSKKLRRDRE